MTPRADDVATTHPACGFDKGTVVVVVVVVVVGVDEIPTPTPIPTRPNSTNAAPTIRHEFINEESRRRFGPLNSVDFRSTSSRDVSLFERHRRRAVNELARSQCHALDTSRITAPRFDQSARRGGTAWSRIHRALRITSGFSAARFSHSPRNTRRCLTKNSRNPLVTEWLNEERFERRPCLSLRGSQRCRSARAWRRVLGARRRCTSVRASPRIRLPWCE